MYRNMASTATLSILTVFSLLAVIPSGFAQSKPNIVLFYADDMGYGDLAIYGHPTSSTPNIDQLANDGLLFTQFYSAAPVCSPSRAAMLTGKYQVRVGVYPSVFHPDSTGGLPTSHTTIASLLDARGYDTYMLGKWHLGYGENQSFIPTRYGFDHYLGIPFSQDLCPCVTCFYPNAACVDTDVCHNEYAPCPLLQDTEIVAQPVNFVTLNEELTNQAKDWIRESAGSGTPFLLYFAFHHTHSPHFAGQKYTNSSIRGIFGDALSEMDGSVGEVMTLIDELGLSENTFTFFASDNGPMLSEGVNGGSSGSLKCGKGTTYEGGVRVPGIAHWPGRIAAGGRTPGLASTLDFLPTFAAISGAATTVDTDGYDLSPLLFQGQSSPRTELFYFPVLADEQEGPYAVRLNEYKAHYYTQGSFLSDTGGTACSDMDCAADKVQHNPPLLFNLNLDPSESINLNGEPWAADVLAQIETIRANYVNNLVWAESETSKPTEPRLQPCCNVTCDASNQDFPRCCLCNIGQSLIGHSVTPFFLALISMLTVVLVGCENLFDGKPSWF